MLHGILFVKFGAVFDQNQNRDMNSSVAS